MADAPLAYGVLRVDAAADGARAPELFWLDEAARSPLDGALLSGHRIRTVHLPPACTPCARAESRRGAVPRIRREALRRPGLFSLCRHRDQRASEYLSAN